MTTSSRSTGVAIRLLLALATMVLPGVSATAVDDPAFPPEQRAKLDTFEGIALDKADKVFSTGDFPRAIAEYEAFVAQFPESAAVPHALLRKGRGLQRTTKRTAAIEVYREVLDFFPDDVFHAAAAAYRIGECHAESGDVEKAMKAWAQLAADEAYVRQPVGAAALAALADNLIRQGRVDEGIGRLAQVAVTFRETNRQQAQEAIRRVIEHHVRARPDVGRLRSFYVAARTFESTPQDPGPDLATDALFWRRVREAVVTHGRFPKEQQAEQATYFGYWAGQTAGKLPDDDELQIAAAEFARLADGDAVAWAKRLDAQFTRLQKPGDYNRIIRWIAALGSSKPKLEEYYAKLDFAKMSNEQITQLVLVLFGLDAPQQAANAFDKLRLEDMPDTAKATLAGSLQSLHRFPASRDLVLRTCLAYRDRDAGKLAALRYLHWRSAPGNSSLRTPADVTDGLRLAEELGSVAEHATPATVMAGNILQWTGKYEEAIAAYQKADDPPQTLFWTAECLQKLGRVEPAVAQLREIESFFKDNASDAALRIAYVFRDAQSQDRYVAALRGVLKKYPKSPQSSEAHQRLEELGLRIGGGVDAEGG
jgi:tetratricopeptide (TPR) repeat protein